MADTRRLIRNLGLTMAGVLVIGLMVAFPEPTRAASSTVTARDNSFDPGEIRIDPGDTIVWSNQGSRIHTVNADDRSYRSGDMRSGDTYSHKYEKEGYYFYFCKYHGARNGVGMAGVVIVGDPPPPPGMGNPGPSDADVLVVPTEFRTIQAAVDAAKPG